MPATIIILMIAGALMLAAAVACYLRNTERFVFPIVLALIGVFMLAADVVKAELPGGIKLEMQNLAQSSSDAAKAVSEASQRNSEAIAALSASLSTSQKAFADYRDEVNERFAAMNRRPVALPDAAQVQETQAAVAARIREADSANREAVEKANALETIVQERLAR